MERSSGTVINMHVEGTSLRYSVARTDYPTNKIDGKDLEY